MQNRLDTYNRSCMKVLMSHQYQDMSTGSYLSWCCNHGRVRELHPSCGLCRRIEGRENCVPLGGMKPEQWRLRGRYFWNEPWCIYNILCLRRFFFVSFEKLRRYFLCALWYYLFEDFAFREMMFKYLLFIWNIFLEAPNVKFKCWCNCPATNRTDL